jgi:hypothetical protein
MFTTHNFICNLQMDQLHYIPLHYITLHYITISWKRLAKDKHSNFLGVFLIYKESIVNRAPGCIFTTLSFLCYYLQISQISKCYIALG